MAEAAPRQLVARYERLHTERTNWEASWQDIADNVIGRRDFTTIRTPGQRRMSQIYDTTALLTSQLLAAGLSSFLTNPATRWFDLRLEDSPLKDDEEVNLWLEEVRDRMLAVFSRGESGFSSQMDEVYQELVWFGTSVMIVLDSLDKGIRFSARPLSECFLAEDAHGRVDTLFRRFPLTARQAAQMFGDRAPEKVKKQIAVNKMDERSEYLHAVFPAGEMDTEPSRAKPWASKVMSFDAMDRFIDEGGFSSNPYLTPRWSTDAGEVYGRGPGFTSLADAKMLNAMSKTVLKAAQKIVDPPMLQDDDGVITQLKTAPGSVNIQRNTSLRGDSVRPLITGGNIPIGIELIQARQQQVRSAYHWELLQLIQDPRMTATQVIALSRNIQRLLSPLLGRMQTEFLEPMIDRVFDLMARRGEIPPPPEILEGGERIKVEYVSPVARAQKSSDADALIRTVGSAVELAAAKPEVLDLIDFDQAVRFLADFTGTPRSILKRQEVVIAERAARAEQLAKQEQQAQLAATVEATSKAVPALAQAAQIPAQGAPAQASPAP